MEIKTKRLKLRELETKDVGDLVRNMNNLNVSKNIIMVPYPYTIKDSKWWVNHCIEQRKTKPRTAYDLGIELKSEGIIGGIGITKVDRYQGSADIGYYIAEDYWRQGYMSEAATAMIDFAFKKLKLRRIEAHVFRENEASKGLVKSLGFKYEGTRKKALRPCSTGKIHDAMIYGLLR